MKNGEKTKQKEENFSTLRGSFLQSKKLHAIFLFVFPVLVSGVRCMPW